MFGKTKQSIQELLSEFRSLRFRVEEVLGLHDDAPLTKAEFYKEIDSRADTPKQKVGCAVVGRVLKVTFDSLNQMTPRDRSAMLRELLK